jgi:hypothetical protein
VAIREISFIINRDQKIQEYYEKIGQYVSSYDAL